MSDGDHWPAGYCGHRHGVWLVLGEEGGPFLLGQVPAHGLACPNPPHCRIEVPEHHVVDPRGDRIGALGIHEGSARREGGYQEALADGLARGDVPHVDVVGHVEHDATAIPADDRP